MISLEILEQKIAAGEEAFDEQGLQELSQNLEHHLALALRQEKGRLFVSQWTALFNTLFDASLARPLAALVDADLLRAFGERLSEEPVDAETTELMHYYLEFLRQPEFLIRLNDTKEFEQLFLQLIQHSRFTVGALLRLRAQLNGDRNWLGRIQGTRVAHITFAQAHRRVNQLARGLWALLRGRSRKGPSVAFLSDNSPEMALLDLACLSSGLVNVMIPANSVSSQIAFILNQTQARILIVGGQKHLDRINEVRRQLESIEHIVMVNETVHDKDILTIDALKQHGSDFSSEQLGFMRKQIRMDDLATVMYTSGTTGEPKGIMFSHLNIIYKRFCRALALPQIGPDDRFLAYLPLYHTFGRYLELMGSLFWGAEYYFMENPALETLVRDMNLVKPTVFISIPKKWQQLFDYITARTDIDTDDEERIRATVREATGGQLRWGLSAAGYLDPAVFRFFQRYGIELLSGFGMTEATGGITMTAPGQYVENALGKPLPGIEVKLAQDGELLIRGPYVMQGYFAQKRQAFTPDGWLPTGDIMRYLQNGYLEIIDRKKEIYKNIRGETIAPQRIEKYFYEFDYVKQAFLIGDNRPYNTVLIYPNMEGPSNPLKKMSSRELHDLFTSVVVTVNNFLAPFERIVDFRLIDRPFSADLGELTPKGTYKRKIIEKNFAELIETMYRRGYAEFHWHGWYIRLPNWFLRERGYLTQDIRITDYGLRVDKEERVLPMTHEAPHSVRIGRYRYGFKQKTIDLQVLLSNPLYWLGNQELIDFSDAQVFQWYRLDRPDDNVSFNGSVAVIPVTRQDTETFLKISRDEILSLRGLHLSILLLQSNESELVEQAVQYLGSFLKDTQQTFYNLVKEIISNPNFSTGVYGLRRLFRLGLSVFKGSAFRSFFERFLQADAHLLNDELIREIARNSANDPEVLKAIFGLIKDRVSQMTPEEADEEIMIPRLFNLLAQIGIEHPVHYKEIRQWLVRYQLRRECKRLAQSAAQSRRKLLKGFRKWIGANQQISIDVETGREYRWQDVMIFDEAINEADRKLLLQALSDKPIIREALFLLGDGVLVGLYDIPPGGVWISQLHQEADHSVYRVSVQTRFQGGFDFVINLERSKATRVLKEEMNWLIHACAPAGGLKLVEEFGGFWKEFNLWTEEYIAGDSLQKYFAKMMRRATQETRLRLRYLWPMFIWTGISAYVSFWRRTGYRYQISDISPDNIMIPPHDYLSGVRIFSIRKRKKSKGLSALILNFLDQYVKPLERTYPFIKHSDKWFFIFSGIIDALGEEKGRRHLGQLLAWLKTQNKHSYLQEYLRQYLKDIDQNGFTPKNLYFAVQRFVRWLALNPQADFSAQLFTLNELYETYRLSELEDRYPGLHVRYFLDSIFKDSQPAVRDKLVEILRLIQKNNLSHEQRVKLFSDMRNRFELTDKEEFFLSRLSYPHLQPEDSAGWMRGPGNNGQQNDVVVTLEDYEGVRYHVRKPISPKEISRLHRIFLEANLPVVFKPEHRYLIAVSERGFVIGGLFYRFLQENTVHIEKIVVTDKYRRKGISEGLMKEFFNRMRDAHFRYVTTGFFRPEYFYRFGFKIERKYAGLVKDLTELKAEEKNR